MNAFHKLCLPCISIGKKLCKYGFIIIRKCLVCCECCSDFHAKIYNQALLEPSFYLYKSYRNYLQHAEQHFMQIFDTFWFKARKQCLLILHTFVSPCASFSQCLAGFYQHAQDKIILCDQCSAWTWLTRGETIASELSFVLGWAGQYCLVSVELIYYWPEDGSTVLQQSASHIPDSEFHS